MQDILVIEPSEGRSVFIGSTRTTIMTRGIETNGRYSLIEHDLPPQTSGPALHVHRHYDHAWYVLEGEVQITCGERIIRARTGTFVLVPKGTSHTFANLKAERARMLEIDSPGGLEHYFEELDAAFPEGTAVDPVVVSAIQRRYDTHPSTN